jgi:hypothetical protein
MNWQFLANHARTVQAKPGRRSRSSSQQEANGGVTTHEASRTRVETNVKTTFRCCRRGPNNGPRPRPPWSAVDRRLLARHRSALAPARSGSIGDPPAASRLRPQHRRGQPHDPPPPTCRAPREYHHGHPGHTRPRPRHRHAASLVGHHDDGSPGSPSHATAATVVRPSPASSPGRPRPSPRFAGSRPRCHADWPNAARTQVSALAGGRCRPCRRDRCSGRLRAVAGQLTCQS